METEEEQATEPEATGVVGMLADPVCHPKGEFFEPSSQVEHLKKGDQVVVLVQQDGTLTLPAGMRGLVIRR